MEMQLGDEIMLIGAKGAILEEVERDDAHDAHHVLQFSYRFAITSFLSKQRLQCVKQLFDKKGGE